MKISIKKVVYNSICIYPFLNILIWYLFGTGGATLFTILHCCLILFYIVTQAGGLKRQIIYIAIWVVVTGIISVTDSQMSSILSSVLFSLTIACFLFFADDYFDIEDFGKYVTERKKFCYLAQVLFLMVLLYHYSIYGLRYGWSTRVLQGPYNYPHTLAYLLLLLAMLDVYLWRSARSKYGLMMAGVNLILMFLTAVRVTLLASIIAILYLLLSFFNEKQMKKFVLAVALGTVVMLLAYRYGIFTALVEKTQLALRHSSITNGRGNIALTSLKVWLADDTGIIWNILFGIGMKELLSSNYQYLAASVHAHNDFVDTLVCYGIINLGIYVYSFHKFAKKNKLWIWLCIGGLAFGNGLFMYIDAIPMLFFARLFFEKIAGKDNSNHRRNGKEEKDK